jgi:hypothetical protein
VIAEIIAVLRLFQKNGFFRMHKISSTFFFGILIGFQVFGIIILLYTMGVFESSILAKFTSVNDPSTKVLQILLKENDVPGNWQWISVNTRQPSSSDLKDPKPEESADVFFAARVPYFSIFKMNVTVSQTVQIFDSILSEYEFTRRLPFQGRYETSFAPSLNEKGKYFYSLCSKGADFYSCDISMGYDYVISSIQLKTRDGLSEQYIIDLLNTFIILTDQRIKRVSQ